MGDAREHVPASPTLSQWEARVEVAAEALGPVGRELAKPSECQGEGGSRASFSTAGLRGQRKQESRGVFPKKHPTMGLSEAPELVPKSRALSTASFQAS